MNPDVVPGVHFMFTFNIPYRAIGEEVDGIMRTAANFLHRNCSLRLEEQPELSHGKSPQTSGSGQQPSLPDKYQLFPNYPPSCLLLKARDSLTYGLQCGQERHL